VMDSVIAGHTDRQICAAFEKQFNIPLAKSSLGRWRRAATRELADHYRLTRFQTTQLLKELGQPAAKRFEFAIANVQDRILSSMPQVSQQAPLKLFAICQRENTRHLRRREVAVKERKLALKERQIRKQESLARDRLAIGAAAWEFIMH